MNYPKIGIRPTIDGRQGGVRESLEEKTMALANAVAELISSNLRNGDGSPVECVIADTTIGRVAEAAACAEKFEKNNVGSTITVTSCWCYGSETMDMHPTWPKAVWGFNGTERPGAVYLAAVLAAHAQKGLPAYGIYGHDVQDITDNSIPGDVAEKILRWARAAQAVATMRGKSYLSFGSVSMGIAGSIVDPDMWQEYLGMRNEQVDQTEILRRMDEGIYDKEEYERAFEWAAFKTAMDKYNEVTQFHFDLWDINRTDYPQVTGNVPWLYRMYSFHLHGGMDDRFLKADDKVRKLMEDGYKKKLPCTLEMRHKALVWSCPANYYTNFSNWLEQCWGIVSVMDMETHVGNVMVDTSTHEGLLLGLAQLYQRTTMRKHTKGGYKNALNEMWSIADAFNCDTIIMYDQISCKGMDGLQGMFDEQARERNINFIWVQQDLMDPRTISRRDMRNQVNSYMTSVLREEPLDPTLVDFDDCDAF